MVLRVECQPLIGFDRLPPMANLHEEGAPVDMEYLGVVPARVMGNTDHLDRKVRRNNRYCLFIYPWHQ